MMSSRQLTATVKAPDDKCADKRGDDDEPNPHSLKGVRVATVRVELMQTDLRDLGSMTVH